MIDPRLRISPLKREVHVIGLRSPALVKDPVLDGACTVVLGTVNVTEVDVVPIPPLFAEAVRLDVPHGEHNMCTGLLAAVRSLQVVNVYVGDHPVRDVLVLNVIADELDPLFGVSSQATIARCRGKGEWCPSTARTSRSVNVPGSPAPRPVYERRDLKSLTG